MALRLELGMPPVHILVRELTEEVRDRLFKWSSELWEARLLFKEPGLTERRSVHTLLQVCCSVIFSMVPHTFLNKPGRRAQCPAHGAISR